MFAKKICLVLLGIAFSVQTISAHVCCCGLGEGVDVCQGTFKHSCTPLVVRPQDVPKPKPPCIPIPPSLPPLPVPVNLLAPVGGPCSCKRAIVKPAVVPKPPCGYCSAEFHHSVSGNSESQHHEECSASSSYGASSGGVVALNPAQLAPADPVSLAIAYKLANQECKHEEGKLSFGFRKLPKELPPVVKTVINVPEEKLYGINGQIVELKVPKCAGKSVDEEAAEDLLQLDEEDYDAVSPIKKPSLGEIGYIPAKIEAPTFVNFPAAITDTVSTSVLSGSTERKCVDGYAAGTAEFLQIPNPEIYPQALPLPEPCESEETTGELIKLPGVPCGYGGGHQLTHHYKHSSSSSSSKHSSKSVILEKLGCV